MTRKTQIRQTALLVTLVYLFLSSSVIIGAERHALKHQHNTDHAAQHASFICTWMCASSSFVHTSDPVLNQTAQPSVENLAVYNERFLNPLSIFSFRIRPPPNPLS